MRFVTARGTTYELGEPLYWHLTQRNDILLHNVRLGEGICWTVSMITEQPGMQDAVTPYSLLRHDTSKEQRFEAIRKQHFPDHPSRDKALFLFVSKDDAQRGLRDWFPGEARQAVEARIVAGSRWHQADARWLERPPAEWDNSARSYWAGEITADPRLEVVIHGGLYFPEWRTFGLLSP